jgi:hypothetical protein
MKVADLPADHRRSARIAPELDFENRLGRLRDHVASTPLAMKNRSIGERMIKIKAKLPSILSKPSPPPLCQRHSIRKQQNDLVVATGLVLTN